MRCIGGFSPVAGQAQSRFGSYRSMVLLADLRGGDLWPALLEVKLCSSKGSCQTYGVHLRPEEARTGSYRVTVIVREAALRLASDESV